MNNPTVVAIHDLRLVSLWPNQFFNIQINPVPDMDNPICLIEVSLQKDDTLLICASDDFIENICVATYKDIYGH